MTRVLLTGASGFVGASVARRLLAHGCDTAIVMRARSNPWRIAAIKHGLSLPELVIPALRSEILVIATKVRSDAHRSAPERELIAAGQREERQVSACR